MALVAYDWIEDVLTDLVEFAACNGLPLTASAMQMARDEMRMEAEKLKSEARSDRSRAPALRVIPKS